MAHRLFAAEKHWTLLLTLWTSHPRFWTSPEPLTYLAWEFFDWHAVRTAAWKATWIREPFGNGDWQLFDMAVDPGESNDVSAQHPEVMQELADKWDVYADEVGVVPREVSEWPDQ